MQPEIVRIIIKRRQIELRIMERLRRGQKGYIRFGLEGSVVVNTIFCLAQETEQSVQNVSFVQYLGKYMTTSYFHSRLCEPGWKDAHR